MATNHQAMTNLTEILEEQVTSAKENIGVGNKTFGLVICACLVFFMQGGFLMISLGAVRRKNAQNIILYILLDAALGSLAYYFVGYAFSFGEDWKGLIGTTGFALIGEGYMVYEYAMFFFFYTFAATSTTIVSGSIIERTQVRAYHVYSIMLTGFIYPVIAHWVWGGGWLSNVFGVGVWDLAGDGPVHMVGGLAGLAGAIVLGPRIGRFGLDGKPKNMLGHSIPFYALGVVMLWFGWFGFNGGSTLTLAYDTNTLRFYTMARVAVATTLSPAGGCLSCFLLGRLITGHWNVMQALNGILAGLVSITAAADVVEVWAAIIIGMIGGALFILISMLFTKLKIDDPLEAAALHGGCGAWGLLAVGFFASDVYVFSIKKDNHCGVFYPGCSGVLLAAQAVGVLTIAAWTLSTSFALFFALKKLGWFRISVEEELAGMDISYHGGTAYPLDPYGSGKKHIEDMVSNKSDQNGFSDYSDIES